MQAPLKLSRNELPEPQRENIRRLIVNLIFVVYWLLIFEGALRKWFFPDYHKALFFLRDPFVIAVYVLALRFRMWPRWSPVFTGGIILSLIAIPFILVQVVSNDIRPIVALYGWRIYFWYLPLAFLIGEHFRGKDLCRLVRHTLFASIPIAILVLFQFKSEPSAFINKTFDQNAIIFTVVPGIVRTSGTFTFTAGQVLFVGSIVPMLLAAWLVSKKHRLLGPVSLVLVTASVFTNFMLNGNRSAFFYAAAAFLAAIGSGFVMYSRATRKRALKVIVLPLVILLIGGIAYAKVFPDALEAMESRQWYASRVEGNTLERAFRTFVDVFSVIDMTPVLGAGIGSGSNAGMMLSGRWEGMKYEGYIHYVLAEDEWSRLVQEGGIMGILYVMYRIWLVGWLSVGAIRATRRLANPLPLLLLSFAAVVLLTGQMTFQGTINGYGWLFAGFCIAANKLGGRQTETAEPALADLPRSGSTPLTNNS